MKLDLNFNLTDPKGRIIQDGGADFTLGEALFFAFSNAPAEQQRGMTLTEKVRRDKVAASLVPGGVQEFKPTEIDDLKNVIAFLPIPIVGAICRLIEAAEAKVSS